MTYDILNSDNDVLATVEAASEEAALEIWRTRLWTGNPYARELHAVEVSE